jgi:hypothetical protein
MSAFGPHVEKALQRDPDLPTKSFVYFIQADDSRMVKIGRAKNITQRLQSLQCGNHENLSPLGALAGARALEEEIHELLAASRVRGEWFRPTPILRELMGAALTAATGRTVEEILAA